MDYEEVAESLNITVYSIPKESFMDFLIVSLVSLISLAADVTIVYTIFKFRMMRTVSNVLLGNWILSDALSILVNPSIHMIILQISHLYVDQYICSIYAIHVVFRGIEMIFAAILIIDWLSRVYFQKLSEKIKNYYKFIVATFWTVGILYGSASTGFCINDSFNYKYDTQRLAMLITYVVLSVLDTFSLCTIGFHKCMEKPLEQTYHIVVLVTGLVVSHFLMLLFSIVYVNLSLEAFAVCVGYLDSVVNLIILYFFNKEFRASFLKMTVRSRNTNGYSRSISGDNENTVNAVNNDVPVQIAFYNQTEELITNAY